MEQLQTLKLYPDLVNQFMAWIDRSDKTTKTYLTCLRQFAAWLKFAGIDRPTREDIILYREFLLSEHDSIVINENPPGWAYRYADGKKVKTQLSAASAALYLTAVKQFFSWTDQNGIYPNITGNIHPPKISRVHRKNALSPADVQTIENQLKDAIKAARTPRKKEQAHRLYCMYLLAVNAGLRCIELSRAKIRDLEVIQGKPYLYIWGKGHSEPDERLPLAPEIYQALQDYLSLRRNRAAGDPLFTATGNRSGGKAIDPRTYSAMFKRMFRAAGYDSDRITAHSLRHTAGTNAMLLTGNVYQVQKYLRHATPTTTELYLHIDDDERNADTAEQLYKLYHSGNKAR